MILPRKTPIEVRIEILENRAMAGRTGPDLNLPSSQGFSRGALLALLFFLFLVVLPLLLMIERLVTGFIDGLATQPFVTLVDTFVILYAVAWLLTVADGSIGRLATGLYGWLRAPYTHVETIALDWLGGTSVAIDEHPRHVRVMFGFLVAFVGFWVTAIFGAYLAAGVILLGGGAWLAVYVLRVLGRTSLNVLGDLDVDLDPIGSLSSTPSADEARADSDRYDLPMSIEATEGDVSRYRGGVLIPRNKSVGMIGATRSGKTEVAKHFVAQMREQRRQGEPVVVYDHKRDFQDALAQWGVKTLRLSATGSSVTWNLFREAATERDLEELGRALFPSGGSSGANRSGSGSQFFDTAARQVFIAVAKYLRRECENKDKEATNALLVRYFQRTDAETLYEDLTDYDDLVGAASAVDPEASRQARGVYATVQQRVTDVFAGDFAEAPGDRPAFSVRGYMKEPQRYVLVLDRPQRHSASTAPIFRFLIDRAAMHALEDGTRGSYFVLDEFARLPQLSRIEELVNVGAGQQTQVVLTLQAVSQLYQTYGRERGRSILAGLATQVLLRAGDNESVEHAREAIGTFFEEYTGHTHHTQFGDFEVETERETQMEEEYPFSKGDLRRLDVGQAVIVQPGGWAFGYVPMLGTV
jgi:hypothetical protein